MQQEKHVVIYEFVTVINCCEYQNNDSFFYKINYHDCPIFDRKKNVINSKIMTFLKKKTVAIDIFVTFKTCHNKRICDIYLTAVNT